MIKINKTYFSPDKLSLIVDIQNTNINEDNFSDISDIYLSKFINGVEHKYDVNKEFNYVNSIYAKTLNINSGYTIDEFDDNFIIFNLNSMNGPVLLFYTETTLESKVYLIKFISSNPISNAAFIEIDDGSGFQADLNKVYSVSFNLLESTWIINEMPGAINLSSDIDISGSFAINLENEISKQDIDSPDFNANGITKISFSHGDNNFYSYATCTDEFYSHKIKLLNIGSSSTNYQKLSKRINAYIFLEQMLNTAIINNYIDDANLYYNEMVKLSNFGYSDIIQNNPNSQY